MKIRFFLPSLFVLLSIGSINAQEVLTLEQAVEMALAKSDESKIAEVRVATAAHELQVTKNSQYPDFSLSGQYKYLTNADINLQLATGSAEEENGEVGTAAAPEVNQLMLGQASVSVPLFSGFKIHNAVLAGENNYKAATSNAQNSKEQLALQIIQEYVQLFKARKTTALLTENLNSAQQRVKDFSALEQNGLLARNDLLKAQLQQANIELALEEAEKNQQLLNYRLALTLKLPEDTMIEISDLDFGIVPEGSSSGSISRNDLEALRFQEKAAENTIKMAESKYYPSVALVGGYMAVDLENTLTVKNAMNIGVGVSYNLSDIFKAKSDVKVAKSRTEELQYLLDMATDKVKVQVRNAEQNFDLALNKLEVFSQSEEQALENFRIVKDKYDNGLLDTNDLLEADIQQLQAKMNSAYAKADISQKYYELLAAQGNLINKFN